MTFSRSVLGRLTFCLALLCVLWMGVALREAVAQQNADGQGTVVLQSAQLESLAGTARVALPHVLQPTEFNAKGSRVRYVLDLDLPQLPQEPLGIYIKKVSLGARLFLNGEMVGACAIGALQELRCLHRPWLIAPPQVMWKPGRNQLMFEVHADERQMNGLSQVQVGPLLMLEQGEYAQQRFLRVSLMQALSWITVILGLLSLMVAGYLPGRSLYLWVGLASLVQALSNLNFLSTVAWPTSDLFSWFAFSSRMSTVSLLTLACVAFYGKDKPRHQALAIAYAAFAPLLVWMTDSNRTYVIWFYVPVLLCGLMVIIFMARWTWQSKKLPHALMLAAVLAILMAGYSDWLRLRGASAFEGVYLMAYASAGFLIIMGSLVMAELAAGLTRSRELAATLEQKVAEREQRLAKVYEQRLEFERTAAINQERERLLADMHDSLGAGLSTAYLLLQQGQLSVRGAAYLVQECMDDLRLVFDVSANLDGSLQTLVADVRYRLDGRMASMGLKANWGIDLNGMPNLDSALSLQLMRILQEAVTNAMRHANARHVQVLMQWRAMEHQLILRVQDDGQGMPVEPQRAGRGLGNMARRAASLGAELDIQPAHPGTVVQLRLKL